MATIRKFEEIEAWQKARELAKEVFKVSNEGDFGKDFKLKNQINSAASSCMDNIAEGFGRGGRSEFVNFLSVANGSVNEVKSQLYSALDRKYITEAIFNSLYETADLTSNKIGSLINYLNKSSLNGQKFKDRTKL
jgi:four helix bundle protein